MTRQTRVLIGCHVVLDLVLGMASFALAYVVRFNLGVFEITKGLPPFTQYLVLTPFVGLLVVLAFHLTGAYRLHRHRTSVDDFLQRPRRNADGRGRRPPRNALRTGLHRFSGSA